MKKICGWCDKPMGFVAGPVDKVSHGICSECLVVQMAAETMSVPALEGGNR